MKTVALPSGELLPAFGQGTWLLGDDPAKRAEEIATLRLGLDLGATLVDTAEMYGDGRSEELVGEAIAGRRDKVFLVSKVLPHHATRRGTVSACEKSLKRLKTDRLDLYLLHWRGSVPLAETLEALIALQTAGKIRHYGVSNLDSADMEEVSKLAGGKGIVTNQLLYNLARRGIEYDLLPWLKARRIPVMAYSPLEQARLIGDRKLSGFARKHSMTPARAALAWLLARDDVIAIPKASRRERLCENLGALDHPLSASQLAELDQLFPPPRAPRALEML
jgi:diketogulonate reductase-like aldo/keto reductase